MDYSKLLDIFLTLSIPAALGSLVANSDDLLLALGIGVGVGLLGVVLHAIIHPAR